MLSESDSLLLQLETDEDCRVEANEVVFCGNHVRKSR